MYYRLVGVADDLAGAAATTLLGFNFRFTNELGSATTSQKNCIGKSILCCGLLSMLLIMSNGKNIENMQPFTTNESDNSVKTPK